MHLRRAATILALFISASACGSKRFSADDPPAQEVDHGSGAATQSEREGTIVQGVATFTATDVARILLVLEQTGLERAKLAADKATTIEVKTYAARMVRERGDAVDRLTAILAQTTRSDDPTPALLETDALRAKNNLSMLDRASFELPFMTEEVSMHARMLGLLEASFVPSTSRSDDSCAADLEEELLDVRVATAAQIVHALRVQGMLRAAGAKTPPMGPEGVAAADGQATP